MIIDTPNGKIDFRTEGKTDYTLICELANIVSMITPPSGTTTSSTYTDKVLYVAKDGTNQTQRETDISKPYLTIANALTYATTGDVISIASGTYLENNLTIPDGVSIKGVERESVRVGTSGSDVFNMGDKSFLIDISLNINDGFSSIVGKLNGTSGIYNVSFYGDGLTGGTGTGIFADVGSGKFIGSGVRFEQGGFETGIRNSSGICTLEDVHVPSSTGNIDHIILSDVSVNGAAITNISDLHHGNTNVNRLLLVDGGSAGNIPKVRLYTPNSNGAVVSIEGQGEYEDITVYGGNLNFQQYAVIIQNLSATGVDGKYRISANHQPFYFYPPLVVEVGDFELNFAQDSTDKNRSAFNIYGAEDLNVGFVERGTEAHIGRGGPFINGMRVLTTDDNTTSTTDGGNFIDITSEAQSQNGSTFEFQSTLSGETILIGTQRVDSSGDYFPFYGIEVNVLTGDTTSSYVIEFWNNTNWVEVKTLHTPKESGYDYADNLFLWDNLFSLIRFGLNEKNVFNWTKKTINGIEAKWVRIRRTVGGGNVQFENIKLVSSAFNVNPDGLFNKTGLSMSKENITLNGNIWSSAGGGASLGNLNTTVGTGADQYTHVNNQALANSTNDAWYIQVPIKYGQMTALPLEISCYYEIQNGTGNISATPNRLKTTVHKILNSGIKVADKTGGTNYELISRDNADTTDLTTADVYVNTVNLLPTGVNTGDAYSTIEGKIHYLELIKLIDLQDMYPEDLLVIKIEFENQDGGANVGLWGLILEGVQYQLGSRG